MFENVKSSSKRQLSWKRMFHDKQKVKKIKSSKCQSSHKQKNTKRSCKVKNKKTSFEKQNKISNISLLFARHNWILEKPRLL